MKTFLKISILTLILLFLSINANYASTPTLSDIATKLNTILPELNKKDKTLELMDLDSIVATPKEDTLEIILKTQKYDEITNTDYLENEIYNYVLSNNILSRTSSADNTHEEIAYRLLIDCIGQLYGYNLGDLFLTLSFYNYDTNNYFLTYNNLYNSSLEKDGFSVKKSDNNIYDFKIDISKTIDMNDSYITESDIKNFDFTSTCQNHIIKKFIESFIIDNTKTTLTIVVAERNNLTQNTYNSILSYINVLFTNSPDTIKLFKEKFPNLSTGDTSFDGFTIEVAPTEEEADFEYWYLGSDPAFKLVKITFPRNIVYPDIDEDLDIFENNAVTNNLISSSSNKTNTVNNIDKNNIPKDTNKVTNSLSKLPQTGKSLSKKDSLYLLSFITFILLLIIITKDIIKYNKNITK